MMGKLIGKGSFGRVYHAVTVNLNGEPVEVIAIKQVEIPTTKSDLMNVHQRASIEALYHEISLLEGLDHENIVQYLGYDSDEAEGHLNIFLEYVAGGSITSCLTKFGPFQEPLVRHFTRQILQGLRYLHNKHILHRVSCGQFRGFWSGSYHWYSCFALSIGYQRWQHPGSGRWYLQNIGFRVVQVE
jgi:serine/threonine protein kinase